ncbi:MAG: hypothetical protein U1A77_04075 [Pirellulales bacterium]
MVSTLGRFSSVFVVVAAIGCLIHGASVEADGQEAESEQMREHSQPKLLLVAELKSSFQIPMLARRSGQTFEQAADAARKKDWSRAEELAKQAVEIAPFLPSNHYNLGCLFALEGKSDEAFSSLEKSVDLGFSDASKLENDADLVSVRGQERFRSLVSKMRDMPRRHLAPTNTTPRVIEQGVAWVGPGNTSWDPSLNVLRTEFAFPASIDAPPVKDYGAVGEKLRKWYQEGTAAGHLGDLYDNCDRDHSNMNYDAFPQLTRVEYETEIRDQVPYGLQLGLFHGGVVLGNSSTAHVGSPFWRSNSRTAYTSAHAVELLYAQYRSNELYVYPEHRDHDVGRDGQGDGFGDVFPANTPYLITSQGSSGSDRAFLEAVACTLAAFRPEVKRRLVEQGLLMPTVQWVFRMANKRVVSREDYLSGVAHPTVFDGTQLNVEKMTDLAHALTPEVLPPWVEIRVVEEDKFQPGRDYFDIGDREKLFDSPCSIARVYRSMTSKRRMVVSAEQSRDPQGKPLKFHWVVLRGDEASIAIKPLNDVGSRAEIVIPFSPRRPIREGEKLESNRTEIGVFADNGEHYSPPAFITWLTLDNEERTYDDQGRIAQVVYRGASDKGHYADPVIDLPKSWVDEYHYDATGACTGWTRTRGDAKEEFNAGGSLIVERDALGRPSVTRDVHYVARARPNRQPPILEQELLSTMSRYRYRDDQDRVGERVVDSVP